MTKIPNVEENEVEFELHGVIQLLNDYTSMYLKKRTCVESPALYNLRNTEPALPFDKIKTLQRLRDLSNRYQVLLELYKQSI